MKIKAKEINGKYNADIVISYSDAYKTLQADSKGDIGEGMAVVAVD
jgi:hypothetical protein